MNTLWGTVFNYYLPGTLHSRGSHLLQGVSNLLMTAHKQDGEHIQLSCLTPAICMSYPL